MVAGVAMIAAAMLLAAAAPSTQPSQTATPVDLSTPKSAVVSAYKALKAGDVAAARQCMTFSSDAQAEDFDLTITQLWAPLALMHAMEARFGDNARQLFSAASLEKAADNAIEEMNHCSIETNNDTAVIGDRKSADPSKETQVSGITLKKQGSPEQWKIVAGTFPELSGEIPPADLPMLRATKTGVATASHAIMTRLAKGDFKTADEAYAAYQAALQQASHTPPSPSSPATAPAK